VAADELQPIACVAEILQGCSSKGNAVTVDIVSERVTSKHRPTGFVKVSDDLLFGKLPVHPQSHLAVESHNQLPNSSTAVP
jgi:hypothetical protein